MVAADEWRNLKSLLRWFSDGLQAEITAIEDEGANQTFELSSGERDPNSRGFGGIYTFLLSDSQFRLPDDAGGTVSFGGFDVAAFVVSQEGTRIWLLLESPEPLPAVIASARLKLSQTDLLKRLREQIDELGDVRSLPLVEKVFGLASPRTASSDLPPRVIEHVQDVSTRLALEKAFGSEVTFLWGPPGTGKTFSIAALVATLLEADETVLVTSHTHAAVEQALWAGVEPASDGRVGGLLAGTEWVEDGRVLKVGPLRDPKIPAECHLDSRLDEAAEERAQELGTILQELDEARAEERELRRAYRPWEELRNAESSVSAADSELARAEDAKARADAELSAAASTIEDARAEVEAARRSFILGRRRRVESAEQILSHAERRLPLAERRVRDAAAEVGARRTVHDSAQSAVERAREAVDEAADEQEVRAALDRTVGRVSQLASRADALQGVGDGLAKELLSRSVALFATLTKLYVDPNMRERSWDTVIIDEGSMAMPPLVAWAASRAVKRVVICGDFRQLPPIVHSRDGVAAETLGTDVFHMRGIPDALQQGTEPVELARLTVQRRMEPRIAELARTLAYGADLTDHEDVVLRQPPEWVASFPEVEGVGQQTLAPEHRSGSSAVTIADTSDLNAWSGRLKGSLSRFNLLSAQVALEVAALLAVNAPRPAPGEPRPIGVVTPYAAQRRYLSKLVEALGDLSEWVAVGTVHTFQGNEADVIIFDSVIGEPHWTARLTNPHDAEGVKRDLNVAVTRARHRVIFIGDGEWLDTHAKPASGLGLLWTHLKAIAPTVSAVELLGDDLRAKVASEGLKILDWGDAAQPGAVTLYDERNFYPALLSDIADAEEQIVLYTPYIGKRRWPQVEPHITAAAQRGIEVVLLHKPLTDDAWQQGDRRWGQSIFSSLEAAGVCLIPVSGVHAKTIVVDGRIVYEGSLNWASQTASYEHMLRLESAEVAALIERMMQSRDLISAFRGERRSSECPSCSGPLVAINQAKSPPAWDTQPLKLACANYSVDKDACPGYIRGAHQRAPFRERPACEKGEPMKLHWTKNGRPWDWRCSHRDCKRPRWIKGDVELDRLPTRKSTQK